MPTSLCELVNTRDQDGYKVHEANIAGHPVKFERHEDWLTTAYWTLPDSYGFEDFLRVAEAMFQEGEAHGWEADSLGTIGIVVGSPQLDGMHQGKATRPLEAEDFAQLAISADDVSFLRLNSDLAEITFSRYRREVGVLFEEKPHQTRSAFRFIAELLPIGVEIGPAELGAFVLQLPR